MMCRLLKISFIYFLYFHTVLCQEELKTLKLVHVIFRHGNRTPVIEGIYPKDPYHNETYSPYGFGQLTNKGKVNCYQLGEALRTRYGQHLGKVYNPTVLEAVTTDSDRTKMSLQLVLASLFPPKDTVLEWRKGLNWQPIPYKQLLYETDLTLPMPFIYCPKYILLLMSHFATPEGVELTKKYAELFSYVEEHTGLKNISFLDFSNIFSTLTSQKDFGLEIPDWAKPIYPTPMEECVGSFFNFSTSTAELKQLSGGFLLKEIMKTIKAKLRSELTPTSRILFLHSAHDINVIYLLSALNVYDASHVPPYGSYVAIEAHEINDIPGIKIFYQDYSEKEPTSIKIPGCAEFCPVEQALRLLEANFPSSDDQCKINAPGDTVHFWKKRRNNKGDEL